MRLSSAAATTDRSSGSFRFEQAITVAWREIHLRKQESSKKHWRCAAGNTKSVLVPQGNGETGIATKERIHHTWIWQFSRSHLTGEVRGFASL